MEFINGLLAFYSILTGFSFSILFFIVSGKKYEAETDAILENENRLERLNLIREELFYNVSYFSLISILIAIFTLFFYVFSAFSIPSFLEGLGTFGINLDLKFTFTLARGFYCYVLLFLVVNSIYSLMRIVQRINYLFSEKLKLDAN